MAINLTKIMQYANDPKWRTIPEKYHGVGEIVDDKGNALFGIFLAARRDLITEIGYGATEACPKMLAACAAAMCELAFEKPVLSAHLLGPAEITPIFCEEGEPDDELFYYAAVTTLAMKNAISSYADYRKEDMKDWKAEKEQQLAAEKAAHEAAE